MSLESSLNCKKSFGNVVALWYVDVALRKIESSIQFEVNEHWSIEEGYATYGNYHYKQHEADKLHS